MAASNANNNILCRTEYAYPGPSDVSIIVEEFVKNASLATKISTTSAFLRAAPGLLPMIPV